MNETISLYFKDATSDKEYHVVLEADGGKFKTFCRWGKRGSKLTITPKAQGSYAVCKKEFDSIVKKQKAKGYTEGESGTPYQGTENAGRVSGMLPQLLNPVTKEAVPQLLGDDDWLEEEKIDGEHLMARIESGAVTGANRDGLIVPISSAVETSLQQLFGARPGVVDGEVKGDIYVVYDLMELDGEDLRPLGCEARFDRLSILFAVDRKQIPSLRLVRCARNTADKTALFDQVKAELGEGLVFKRKNAPYVPERPTKGGDMLKFKFKGSGTFLVAGQNNAKRSVMLCALTGEFGATVGVGSVTIPSNHEIPLPDTFCEVEYLYFFPNGSLFQSVYKGPRSDKHVADHVDTLKLKQDTAFGEGCLDNALFVLNNSPE